MDGQADLELERPRGAVALIGTTFDLYWRFPLLFLILAAVVVVPYELIVLLVTGDGPLNLHVGFLTDNLIGTIDAFFVTSVISALHVHAVREVRDGGRPRLLPTFRQSLHRLPIVALAAGVSWIGIAIGTVALIVPGLILWATWAVVAQTAALEGGSWIDALRSSADLTRSDRWHALGLVLGAALIAAVPTIGLHRAFGHHPTTVGSFLAGTALQIVVRSFTALTTGLLYFELKGRSATPASEPAPPAATIGGERAPGWYIDPQNPRRMRYWNADGKGGWSEGTTKAPKQTLREWEAQQR